MQVRLQYLLYSKLTHNSSQIKKLICLTPLQGMGALIYKLGLTPLQGLGAINYSIMNIQVLGTGCPKCKSLEKATREIVEQNNIDATITKVEDIMEILKFNIMTTPALVIDGKVVVKGRVPSMEELKQILTNKIYIL